MTLGEDNYILAASRAWSIEAFLERRAELHGNWTICVSDEDLFAAAGRVRPRLVFFPHWSTIVPDAFLTEYECVCFHMTDLPYGRGGSPLQNLILAGHTETKVSALRMTGAVDAGPIYLKKPMSLDGTASEIFRRVSRITVEMMTEIVRDKPRPIPQSGAPFQFRRRKPTESQLPENGSIVEIFDHIRMLDAPGYPHAFIQHGDWTISFSDAIKVDGRLEARAKFRKQE